MRRDILVFAFFMLLLLGSYLGVVHPMLAVLIMSIMTLLWSFHADIRERWKRE